MQITALEFSPDGNLLVTGSSDGNIMVWDIAEAKRVALLDKHRKAVWSLAFSHGSGSILASGEKNGDVLLRSIFVKLF